MVTRGLNLLIAAALVGARLLGPAIVEGAPVSPSTGASRRRYPPETVRNDICIF